MHSRAGSTFEERTGELRSHMEVLARTNPNFVDFYNQVRWDLVPRLFADDAEVVRLEQTATWCRFRELYYELSRRVPDFLGAPRKTITPRIPADLADRLAKEASQIGVSRNKLYILKLSQPLPEASINGVDG